MTQESLWTLVITRNFLISFWKLDHWLKAIILDDIKDIYHNVEDIEKFDDIEIIDEYDDKSIIPEHTVIYYVDHDKKRVYFISINETGIKQKLEHYR